MRVRRIVVLCCLVLGGLSVCHEGRSETALTGVDDLVEWFKIQQERVLPIAPPMQGPFLQRGFPDALPFDQDGMPYALLKKLPGYVEYDRVRVQNPADAPESRVPAHSIVMNRVWSNYSAEAKTATKRGFPPRLGSGSRLISDHPVLPKSRTSSPPWPASDTQGG